MATFEMWWDCPRCGADKLLGKTHRYCPSCGAPQEASARYFPPQHLATEVTDHRFVGADVVCSGCDTPCSAAAAHCPSCGAPMGDDDALAATVADRPPPPAVTPPKPRPRWLVPLLSAVGGLLALGVFAAVITAFWTTTITVTVAGVQWERAVEVERFQTVSDASWCDSTPSDARGVSSTRKQRSTRSVPDGQTCTTSRSDNGDGTYSTSESCTTNYREEPVYDQWCTYQVDRWRTDHWDRATGSDQHPRWPAPATTGCADLGCTRLGQRAATYTLIVTMPDGKDELCEVEEARWAAVGPGDALTAKQRVVTGGLVCDTVHAGP